MNFRKGLLALYVIISFCYFNLSAQTSHIDNVLALNISTFSRTSLSQVDYIESLLIQNKFEAPSRGDVLRINDTLSAKWISLKADSNNWINDDDFRSGYMYYNYKSGSDKTMLLEGYSYSMVYINSEPRIGNVYGWKDNFEDWEPKFNFSIIPVEIHKGDNHFLFQVNYGAMKAVLKDPESLIQINDNDLTLPDIRAGKEFTNFGSIVLINSSSEIHKGLELICKTENGKSIKTDVPDLQPYSVRKVKFNFAGNAPVDRNKLLVNLKVYKGNTILDSCIIPIKAVSGNQPFKETFISNIDESVQYYAVNPPSENDKTEKALFLSLHGAGVEAINQASSYANKNWGVLVSPTNRRPYGYNWEDIGRLDALEVLDIALNKFNIDPERIYLTGHSMGGHGTWYIGANYSDKFAAIAPSAGWISLWSYRYRDSFKSLTPIQELFHRPSKQSDTYTLSKNYDVNGIYILHGSDDDNVPPTEARNMIKNLEGFHKDFVYHEEPGVGHWWDKDDEPGADCVDWQPMFDYFARHARPLDYRINHINFVTANPGISSKKYWVEIIDQIKQFEFSNINIEYLPVTKHYIGTTSNVKILALKIREDAIMDSISISIDNTNLRFIAANNIVYLENNNDKWNKINNLKESDKSPNRYGTFNSVFNNNVILVYGTSGTENENKWAYAKARYDAETLWYNGNSGVITVADKDFNKFDDPERNVILYGNSQTNTVWDKLLKNSPVSVTREQITVDDRIIEGKDLSCFFIYPRTSSQTALVGVISGTSITGINLCNARPIMKPGFPFPDFVVFSADILTSNNKGIEAAGFFGSEWTVKKGEFIFN